MITRWMFPRLHAARVENHRLHEIIKYQNARMRTMAAERVAASAAERLDASTARLVERVQAAKVRSSDLGLPAGAVCRTTIRDGAA